MKKVLALVLAAMMLLGMMPFALADGVVSVTIPHYKTGENVGAIFFLPQVERFNALYEGKYHIEIEELTQDMYADKIQQLGQQNKLPVLIFFHSFIKGDIDRVGEYILDILGAYRP